MNCIHGIFEYIYRSGQTNEHHVIDPTIKGSKSNMIHLQWTVNRCQCERPFRWHHWSWNDAFPAHPHADGITVWESEMPAFLDVVMQTSASESCLYQVCLPASTSARRQEVKSTCHVTKASWVYTGLKESGRVMMVSRHTPVTYANTLTHLKK